MFENDIPNTYVCWILNASSGWLSVQTSSFLRIAIAIWIGVQLKAGDPSFTKPCTTANLLRKLDTSDVIYTVNYWKIIINKELCWTSLWSMLSIGLNGWQQTTLVYKSFIEWDCSYIEWSLTEPTALNKTIINIFLIMHWGQGQQQWQWYTALSTTIYSLIKARYNSAPKSTHRVSHRQNFLTKKIESDFIEILLNFGGIITPCTHMTKKCPGFSTISKGCLLFNFCRAEAKHHRA